MSASSSAHSTDYQLPDAYLRLVDATAIHHVITDADLPAENAEALRTAGIKLTLV